MKQYWKQVLSILLAMLMLSSLLLSCAEQPDDNKGETTTADSSGKSEETTDGAQDSLPKLDFKGAEVNIIGYLESDLAPKTTDSADVLADAMYNRDRYVEERLHVKIIGHLIDDYDALNTSVDNAVTGGADTYQIAYAQMVFGTSALAMKGRLMNLYDLQYYNSSSPWWDKNVDRAFQIGDTLYMTAGDILPANMMISACIAFNKKKMTDSGMEFPYQMAKNGEWTIDQMIAMTKDRTKDLNGDGKMSTDDDFYGFVSWHLDSPFNFFYGSGCTVFTKDEDNMPVFSANAQKIEDVYSKVYELFITNESYYEKDVAVHDKPFEVFTDGRALFAALSLSTVSRTEFKDMSDKFGVLPQPKYEVSDEYLSFVNGSADMVCVPMSVSDADMVGATLEALGSASYSMVTDILREKVCKAKNVNDEESAEMVDIIFRHRVYDFGYVHFFPLGHSAAIMFQTALDKGSSSVGTLVSRCNDRALKKNLEDFLKSYSKK